MDEAVYNLGTVDTMWRSYGQLHLRLRNGQTLSFRTERTAPEFMALVLTYPAPVVPLRVLA